MTGDAEWSGEGVRLIELELATFIASLFWPSNLSYYNGLRLIYHSPMFKFITFRISNEKRLYTLIHIKIIQICVFIKKTFEKTI